MQQRVKHLVVDSGAFIKNSPVQDYAEHFYSVNGAVKEIRDKATRQRLQILPYTLTLKEPNPDIFKYVAEFSKKTGDYCSLSATDLQIIALTYELQKENGGVEHLNKEPICQVTGKTPDVQQPIQGFYYPENDEDDVTNDEGFSEKSSVSEDYNQNTEEPITESDHDGTEDNEVDGHSTENGLLNNEQSDEDYDKENDDDSWITPYNLAEIQQKMGNMMLDPSDCEVACVTTDFAIQNVLLQMGLHVVSVDGMLIKHAKVFILRCFACFRTTSIMTTKFCPNCGNQTLKRVAVTVNKDGTKKIHINFRRPINIRGTKYSLPKPQGGKHAQNPHLCPDQPFPQNRPAKAALKKLDVFSPEYVAGASPFAVHDVYSRAANLGIHGQPQQTRGRKNPNAWGKRTGNKKK